MEYGTVRHEHQITTQTHSGTLDGSKPSYSYVLVLEYSCSSTGTLMLSTKEKVRGREGGEGQSRTKEITDTGG